MLPKLYAAHEPSIEPESLQLNPEVASQLWEYVSVIARCYRSNKFRCFEHACCVTMSAAKLLSRIVRPENTMSSFTSSFSSSAESRLPPLLAPSAES
jgi:hypothetical protein